MNNYSNLVKNANKSSATKLQQVSYDDSNATTI